MRIPEFWYDEDRQALMVGNWPYGNRARWEDISPLVAAAIELDEFKQTLRDTLVEAGWIK